MQRLIAAPSERMHLWLMLALTFCTGIVDAVGFLGLDRVFTGNMTGNVVILGMAVMGADDLPVLGPMLALVGFLVGAAAGGRALRRWPPGSGWGATTTALLVMVATGLMASGVTLLLDDAVMDLTVTGVLGASMGLQAVTARAVAVKDVTTVVVTSTITGLAADSRLGGGSAAGNGRRAAAVVLLTLGAALGAGLVQVNAGSGLFVAGSATLLVALVGHLHTRSRQPK